MLIKPQGKLSILYHNSLPSLDLVDYKLPRLNAIKTIIAGPAVITKKREINCNKVVGLKNIIKSPIK